MKANEGLLWTGIRTRVALNKLYFTASTPTRVLC